RIQLHSQLLRTPPTASTTSRDPSTISHSSRTSLAKYKSVNLPHSPTCTLPSSAFTNTQSINAPNNAGEMTYPCLTPRDTAKPPDSLPPTLTFATVPEYIARSTATISLPVPSPSSTRNRAFRSTVSYADAKSRATATTGLPIPSSPPAPSSTRKCVP